MPTKPALVALLLAGCPLASCATPVEKTVEAPPAPQPSAKVGIDLAGIDRAIKPGDDFEAYANGVWTKTTEIPADRASTGIFDEVFNKAEKRNADLIADIVKSAPAADSEEGKIAAYYTAYLDRARIDSLGMKPVEPALRTIAELKSKAALSRYLGGTLRADVDPMNATNWSTENLFGLFVTQGLEEPDTTMPYLLQGGLGLPERDYYISSDPAMVKIREAYRTYIGTLLTAAGIPDAAKKAEAIYALELKIAKVHATQEQSQEWRKANNVWTPADFAKKAPGIDWTAYFDAAQLGGQQRFIAWHPVATAGIAALVHSEPLATWKAWATFHLINQYFPVLPQAIDDAHFAFYGKILNGIPQQRTREKRAIASVNGSLGDAIGKLYVKRYFPSEAKAQVKGMVDNILAAFDTRVAALEWMTPKTKEEARAKIKTLRVGIGYPETWRDYSTYEVKADDAFGNAWRGDLAEYRHQIGKIGKPVDRGEWWMTPQTVNAVNLPLQNALNFPAAILDAPFYDPASDPAANYGATGATIGHEISHSFDNNGADFDSEGRMRNWWTAEDLAHFKQAGQALANQFSAYEPFPGLHIKGELTLGENIADVAGLSAAYDAYHASLGGKEAPVIDGLTGDQRFFLAYAQSWREKTREAALRQQLATDGHAPGSYRALTVRNLDAWYKAVEVQPGEKLYLTPDGRVRVW
jgi:putative endopeptidase